MDVDEFIKMHDLSANEFAFLADCAPSTVGLMRRKITVPRLDLALRIHFLSGGKIELSKMLPQDVWERIRPKCRCEKTNVKIS